MQKYYWLKDSYKLIKDILLKEDNIPYHILLSAKPGSEENQLIWYIIRSLLCTKNTELDICDICDICTNCNLIKQTENHPDLCYLKIDKNDYFNTSHFEQLLNFSKHLPLFCKIKIIVILYERSNINETSILLIISLFKHINRYYSYTKIFLKVDIYLLPDVLSYLLTYCLHIPISPPSEDMCILWLKENNKKLISTFDNDDILTAIRINRNILKDTILFFNIYWSIYIKFINIVIKHIKNKKFYYLFKYILDDIKNSCLYLYWFIEFLLDILKIKYNISDNCIINKRYYFSIKSIFNISSNEFNNNLISVLLKDVIDCYSKLIQYPLINRDILLLELTLKWVIKIDEKKNIKI